MGIANKNLVAEFKEKLNSLKNENSINEYYEIIEKEKLFIQLLKNFEIGEILNISFSEYIKSEFEEINDFFQIFSINEIWENYIEMQELEIEYNLYEESFNEFPEK